MVEVQGELTIHEEVVVDSGQAGAQLKLRLLIAQVHGSCQGEVVITCCIKWVLRVEKTRYTIQYRVLFRVILYKE